MGTSQSRNRLIGGTVLIEAVERGDIDLVRRLIAEGADVNAKNNRGNTALNVALRHSHDDIGDDIVRLLLAVPGIDVNAKDRWGDTALMAAAKAASPAEFVSQILDAGADVNEKDRRGDTVLNVAIRYFALGDIVRLLLAVPGIDVEEQDRWGDTALMNAVGYDDIVRQLLDAGADVNAQNNNGDTALMRAAALGSAAAAYSVRLLLAVPGIDVNAKNNNGETALEIAERTGRTDVVRTISSFLAEQAMNRWIPRHRSRQRDRLGLRELDRGTAFMDQLVYYIQGFL